MSETQTELLTAEDIVDALCAADWNELPEKAIRAAQNRPQGMSDALVDLVKQATERFRHAEEVAGNGHFYALYLLSEFGAPEVLELLTEILHLPGEGPFEALGDAVHNDVPRMLAQAIGNKGDAVLEQLIRDPAVNEYVRAAAAVTYNHLVQDKVMSREQAAGRLEEHLRFACDAKDGTVASWLVCELDNYVLPSSLPLIEQAFELGLVDDEIVDLDYVQKEFAKGDDLYLEKRARVKPSRIEDTVEELKGWASFHESAASEGLDEKLDNVELDHEWDDDTEWTDDWNEPLLTDESEEYPDPSWHDDADTIRNETRRVGRNEPCTCGSGKKYKKCCGKAGL